MKFSEVPEHVQNQAAKEIIDLIHLYRLNEEKAKHLAFVVKMSIPVLYEDKFDFHDYEFSYEKYMSNYVQR